MNRRLGFEVIDGVDLDKAAEEHGLREFARAPVSVGDIGLPATYWAGSLSVRSQANGSTGGGRGRFKSRFAYPVQTCARWTSDQGGA
jgi:hypothetical protein